MSATQKNMKYLKEKQKNLNFFSQYLDISKLRLLQLLNEEQEALNVLNSIKFSHVQFLNKMNNLFFKNEERAISKLTENENTWKTKPENKIYFLVDSKEHDMYSDVIYKKLEEILANKVRKNDVIVTCGTRVNLIAQKLELNIIQHFSYDVYLNQDDFIDKVANIIEVGLKNKIFSEARLVIAQHNKDNKEIINKKLVPFETNNQDLKILNDNLLINSSKNPNNANFNQNSNEGYTNFFNSLDFKSIHWFPNIVFFKYKFIKSIIKQNIVELTIVEKIQRLKMEIYLLDEKKNKLNEELVVVSRWINRVRKEKATEATIILHSAFKLKLHSEDKPEDILIRKKKEFDLLGNKKKVLVKKGGR